MLSEHGNPEFRSLDALLHALGFRLTVAMNSLGGQIAEHLNELLSPPRKLLDV